MGCQWTPLDFLLQNFTLNLNCTFISLFKENKTEYLVRGVTRDKLITKHERTGHMKYCWAAHDDGIPCGTLNTGPLYITAVKHGFHIQSKAELYIKKGTVNVVLTLYADSLIWHEQVYLLNDFLSRSKVVVVFQTDKQCLARSTQTWDSVLSDGCFVKLTKSIRIL